ncbi:glycoside-pentoside-hexuronide (GPH):cation symporter [Kallipyga massiliensis]|uniref:glycoside-pentoside-hexuronide (GPH):cation symporter n=1 Tax=Kallipyga massiliensis TaxID=1472764 RepID=UPI0004AE3C8B|nr:glycoside-pentoside-hexuronide (GPH):cation symporter [Kallipyga massiliensis]
MTTSRKTPNAKSEGKMSAQDRRNMFFFGAGTLGRDMFYAFEANALIYYLSNILNLPREIFIATSLVFTILRVFDALNDPLMGLIVDNIDSKHGKFKPPMLVGALGAAACYLILFYDFGFRNFLFPLIFAIAYLGWDLFFGLNDIAYWSMLPSLSLDPKVREKMGACARIFANLGMFTIMIAWQPITSALGNTPQAWFTVALTVTALMLFFHLFPLLGVKEKPQLFQRQEEKTGLKDMWRILTGNDQLLWTTLAMSLFTVGYVTTTTVSIYYMQYVFGDQDLYPVLAAVVGVAQIGALLIFPAVSKGRTRRQMYQFSTILVVIAYLIMVFAETSLYVLLGAALLLFVGEAFIQLLMLMFLEDTVEYGQWKLGSRNESITLSVQPLINKIGGALSMGIVSLALVLSGIKQGAEAAQSIDAGGQMVIRLVFIGIPLVFIIAGYLVYHFKFKINEELYQKILQDLEDRGQIRREN